jgi:hypothetical protein
MRYDLTDYEYATIKSMLPNKPRGVISAAMRSASTLGITATPAEVGSFSPAVHARRAAMRPKSPRRRREG